MAHSLLRVVVATGAVLAHSQVLSAAPPQPSTELHVLLYDYSNVRPEILDEALGIASEVLRQAGIGIVWHHCTTGSAPPDPGCETALDATMVTIKILNRMMSERYGRQQDELGRALQPTDGEFGIHILLFFHRVDEMAALRRCSIAVLLAHAMAHEIGHTLLGKGGHSRRGIMKAQWSEWELLEASDGRLVFTPEQAERLRTQLQRRDTAVRLARK